MKSSEWEEGVLDRFRDAYSDAYDFARCQRPDGSYYGTSGTCRKGAPVDAKKSVVTERMKKAIEEDKPFAQGGFSELYMVDGKVVKVQEDAYLPDIQKEMDMQKMAADAGLAPKVYGVEQVGDDKVIIVMDPIAKGMKNPPSMDDYAPTMLAELDRPTMLAGGELYGKMLKAGIVHADYHTGNWFIDSNGNTQAIDFGISSKVKDAPLKHLNRAIQFTLPVLQSKGEIRLSQKMADAYGDAGKIRKLLPQMAKALTED
jgi:tRNA A-37 threonylcarbamoyl transferase component Bud32